MDIKSLRGTTLECHGGPSDKEVRLATPMCQNDDPIHAGMSQNVGRLKLKLNYCRTSSGRPDIKLVNYDCMISVR
jgi:hypothetical protein